MYSYNLHVKKNKNHVCSAMVSVLVPSEVDRGFELRSGQAKDYKIGIWCFSAKLSIQQ